MTRRMTPPWRTRPRGTPVQLRKRSLIGGLAVAALAATSLVVTTSAAQAVTVSSYTTSIVTDDTVVYYPTGLASGVKLPFVLLLQGADVDQAYYSSYASQVAEQGLIVITENHDNAVLGDNYAAETQVSNTATWAAFENVRAASPLKS